MPNICFYKNRSGTLVGMWPGVSRWTENGTRKQGSIYLGKVINQEKLIFYKHGEGFYVFNPEDQSKHEIDMGSIPQLSHPMMALTKSSNCTNTSRPSKNTSYPITNMGMKYTWKNFPLDLVKSLFKERPTCCIIRISQLIQQASGVSSSQTARAMIPRMLREQ